MEPEDVTFQLLEEITNGFSEERRLGEGAFGVVYKGLTKNGEYVAVKKLRDNLFDLDSNKQFQNELHNLTKLKHQNIVRLFGYCYQIEQKSMEYNGRELLYEETHRALCLEYLHNGSLQKHLSDESSGFDWHTRYKIMKGICEGLKHIHEELEEPLYHLDLKPDNILLDKNMVPKLADFGLSRIFGKELKRTTKSPLGTLGYQPPEYIERGEISKKFDIFSLGVLMIRIVSGYEGYVKCANMHSEEFIDLVKTNWRNRLQETWSGSSLEAYCYQVETCTHIALTCVETNTQKRPDIVKVIDKLNAIEIDNGKHPQNLTMHNKTKMQIEPHDTTYQKQHFSLMTSSMFNEIEFVDIRETLSDFGEEFIVGRTEEKRKIMASLLKSMMPNIILPFYGIGGIGKTTFAKLIYDDTNFNHYSRIWVYVSPRFDLNKVGNSIVSQLSGDESKIQETQMIYCYLKKLFYGKKILIVLDDLWEDNLFQLSSLKDMLNPGGSTNLIVLVTTRSKHVAENISINIRPHEIEPLTDGMCWDIIKQRSGFEAKDHKEQLIHIGKEIALKCRGVALAARSLGFMLQSLELYDQWVEVKESEMWNESISEDATLPNHVLASLKLSCTKMGPCLMSCFTYCAIFPKGHKIIKEDLIHQWISLGFIEPTKLHSNMQLCEKYILQLLGLSFLQHPMSPDPMSSTNYQAYKKGLTLFTMHDLVHDLARLLIVGKILDASNIGGWGYQYARLTDCPKPLKSLTDLPVTVRALHFQDCCFEWVEKDAFLPAKPLQVLDLSGCEIAYLPTSIGELVQLRYLNAPKIKSKMLPDSLTKLSELIYLNLSGSNISALPDSIGEIKGLMHLDISGCKYTSELPESFANLKNLVHLDLSHCHIKITEKAFGGLTNIQHLNLSCNSSPRSDRFEVTQEFITSLTELRYLGLSGCFWTQSSDEILRFIDSICTLRNLVHLDLSNNWDLLRVPESIGNLRKLHTLYLSECWNLETLPECMLKMDSLKVVNVAECPRLDKSMIPRSKCFFSLPYVVVHAGDGKSSGDDIGLLRHVNPEEMNISTFENLMPAEEVHSIELNKNQEIESWKLEWTRDARRSVEDIEVLGRLVPPENLNSLELRGYHSVSFPTWVMGIARYLPHLTKIVLWELRKCNSLPPLGQLPSLGELVMGGMDSITTIEEGFCAGPGAFVKLMKFHLCQMENLEVWNTTYSCGQNNDVQEFMFPNLRELLIRDCPKLRLKPCPPKTERWKIETSDKVLSSWDEEGEIDLAALISSRKKCKKLWQGKMNVPPAWRALWGKCRNPGESYNACPEYLEVKSSKVPLEQWRLFHHLLPTYHLRIKCCAYVTSGSQQIIRDLSYIKSICLEDDALTELPKWLGELTYLKTLKISKYPRLEAPLESTKQLTCLRQLWLHSCGRMSTLLQWLGELRSLRNLIISDWTSPSDLPDSIRRLSSIQRLCLVECPIITALPEWLGDLSSLKLLVIDNCGGIESLPESMQKLTRLERLRIGGPEKLVQWCELDENEKKLAHIRDKVLSYEPLGHNYWW